MGRYANSQKPASMRTMLADFFLKHTLYNAIFFYYCGLRILFRNDDIQKGRGGGGGVSQKIIMHDSEGWGSEKLIKWMTYYLKNNFNLLITHINNHATS